MMMPVFILIVWLDMIVYCSSNWNGGVFVSTFALEAFTMDNSVGNVSRGGTIVVIGARLSFSNADAVSVAGFAVFFTFIISGATLEFRQFPEDIINALTCKKDLSSFADGFDLQLQPKFAYLPSGMWIMDSLTQNWARTRTTKIENFVIVWPLRKSTIQFDYRTETDSNLVEE